MSKIKIRYPLVLKLILIISIIVITSAGIVTIIASIRFSADSRARTEKNNFDMNELQSTQVQNTIDNITSSIYLLFDTFRTIKGNRLLENVTISNFWIRNANIAAIILPGEKELYNTTFFRANELETGIVPELLLRFENEQKKAVAGSSFLFNASPSY